MRLMTWAAAVTVVALVASCGARINDAAGTNGGTDGGGSAGRAGSSGGGAPGAGGSSPGSNAGTLSLGGEPVPACRDSDGDGLNDLLEGFDQGALPYHSDDDLDMVPNYLDADSDGDGLSDATEGGVETCGTAPRDSDGDGLPDFREADSDADGLIDALEVPNGFSPTSPDTDGNVCPDFQEYVFGDCVDPTLVLEYRCFSPVQGELVLDVPAEVEGSLTDLTLSVAHFDGATASGLAVAALSIAPPEAGDIDPMSGRLISVLAGAEVTFVVDASFPSEDWRAYLVAIESEAFGRVATGRVIVTGSDPCPIPK